MKNFLIATFCLGILFGCSRKTIPPKPNTTLDNNNNNNTSSGNVFDSTTAGVITADSLSIAAVSNVMVVADGYGKLITPQQSIPENSGVSYNSLQLSKGFTVQQRANLHARYSIVPPRVLYVADNLSSKSLKGNYYIYNKKFWYWKKPDGLYYLDQKYYQ